jgi:flagellar biosynthetic protein FliR
MTVTAAPDAIAGFLLALVRASAWLTVAPPFGTRTVPVRVKVALAVAIALAVAPQLPARVPLDTAGFLEAVLLQTLLGLVLGFVALVLLSSVQAAGSLIDLAGGFTLDQAYDPLSNAQSSVFGRFHQLLSVTLLFAIDGHLMLVRGFVASFEAIPAGGLAANQLAELLTRDLGRFFLAALEIAGPLVAALFLSEVALGLLSRAAPQLNVFQIGFPLKILLTLLLIGATLTLMPDALGSLVDRVMQSWAAVSRMVTG